MTEQPIWTPAQLREIDRIIKQINGTPEKMVRLEIATKAIADAVHDLREEHEKDMVEIKAELSGSKWSRGQIMVALGVVSSFLAAGAAVASVIFG